MESFRASLSLLVDRIKTWGSEKDFLSHLLELDIDVLRLCGSSGSFRDRKPFGWSAEARLKI